MYHFIEGTLCESPRGYAVLDVGGVGYLVAVSDRTAGELFSVSAGARVRLYTYLGVREDAMELYGFLTESEKEAFLLLTSVSGVGAKGALSVLSALTPERLAFSVLADDAKAISTANGIGLKTAQKIILELKDKFTKDPALSALAAAELGPKSTEPKGQALKEAVDALVVLGYPRAHVLRAAEASRFEGMQTEEIIRQLLQTFGGQ